ncbi:unnamed protein product [Enterobius vermicularis]|uniref:DNA helicase n=1 Tax=Enterobius vermicularis TaxID=51028 RepID=A0A0N4V7Q7_ENTVE|nr:unnamed protein product [Enterobius vermicularis]
MSVNSFENERRRVAHRSAAASVQLMKDLAFKKQSLSQMVNRLASKKRDKGGKKENRFCDLMKGRSQGLRSRPRKVVSSDEEEEFSDEIFEDEEGIDDESFDEDLEENIKKESSPSSISSSFNDNNMAAQADHIQDSDSSPSQPVSELIRSVPTGSTSWLCKPRLSNVPPIKPQKSFNSIRRKRAVISSSDEEEEDIDKKAPVSLKLNVRRVKRLKKDARLSDESDAVESEGSAHLAESSDSDDSTRCRGKHECSSDTIGGSCVKFFNVATREKLMDAPRMTEKVADYIINSRPFTDYQDLHDRLSCCPRGSTVTESYLEYLENRGILERILDDCRTHSKLMQEALEGTDSKQLLIQPKLLTKDCVLHEYQLLGLNWLIMMHKLKLNAILGDEMGLGKTIQVIAFLAYLKEVGTRGPHLVVCPSSTIENWMVELAKWAPCINVLTYYGSIEDRMRLRAMATDTSVDLLLTTYNMIGSRPEDRKFFKRFKINYAIYDEGHLLKNCTTQRYKNLMKVRGERKILMTGTPLQNNLIELISLMYFTMTKLFTEYCDDITQLLQQFQQVLGCLPKKHEKVICCEMIEAQKRIYSNLLRQFREVVSGEIAASSRLMQLRQVSNHPLLYRSHYTDDLVIQIGKVLCKEEDDYSKKNPDYVAEDLAFMSDFAISQLCSKYHSTQKYCLDGDIALESGKFKELDKILPQVKEKGDKVLIFSQFTTMLDILEVYLRIRGHKYCRLDGSTPVMERQELINTFNLSDDIFAFLLSTKAGGMGINLAAANHIILHDIDFNPYNDKQAEDRCHRMGQVKEVYVTRFVSAGTVEEAMLSLAEKKLELEKEITGEGMANGNAEDGQIVEQLLKKALAS